MLALMWIDEHAAPARYCLGVGGVLKAEEFRYGKLTPKIGTKFTEKKKYIVIYCDE